MLIFSILYVIKMWLRAQYPFFFSCSNYLPPCSKVSSACGAQVTCALSSPAQPPQLLGDLTRCLTYNANCQSCCRWTVSALPSSPPLTCLFRHRYSFVSFFFQNRESFFPLLLVLTHRENQTRPHDPDRSHPTVWAGSLSWMSRVTAWHTRIRSHKHTRTHPQLTPFTWRGFCEQTQVVYCLSLMQQSQSLYTCNTHTHTQEYLQPCLRVITIYTELIMFYRTINNWVCSDEAGGTEPSFRVQQSTSLFQSSKAPASLSALIAGFLNVYQLKGS